MNKYTFKLSETNKSNNTISNNNYDKNYYSKVLDNLIHADIIEKNPYLVDYGYSSDTTGDVYLDKIIGLDKKNTIKINGYLKDATDFANAANFLANYNKTKAIKLPYEYGKTYTLTDGTPIIFFDDSIQIGFDLYYYNDFNKPFFLENLTPSIKKTICTIYVNGLKITIKD